MTQTAIDTAVAGEVVPTPTGDSQAAPEAFKAPESQEELDRIIQKRIDRERAKFADYDDIKTKFNSASAELAAAKAELEDATKAAGRVGDLEAGLSAAEKRAERAEVAAEVASSKGVKLRYLAGDTREELESSADAWLEDARSFSKVGVIPTQGTGESAPRPSTYAAGAERARASLSKNTKEQA